MKKITLLLTFCFSLFHSHISHALQLAPIFTDNMVFQQQQVLPIWGKAKAGAQVTVSFLNQKIITTANKNGDWLVEILPLMASYSPEKLIVELTEEGDKEVITINNILIGEVWLSSGQSNMRFTLGESLGGNEAVAESENNNLRLINFTNKTLFPTNRIFNVEELEQLTPDNYFQNQGWQVSSAISSEDFSAVAYHFALQLQQKLDVPVGIINVSVGGSLMENFISNEKLASIKSLAKLNGYWLDNIPQWCAERAKYNLTAWFKKHPNTLPNHPFKPSFLFEAGIKPLVPFAVKGVIWYQGESNAPIHHSDTQYSINMGSESAYQGEFSLKLSKLKFKTLISDWREQWKNNNLPFYFVQLPGLNRPWAPYRQMQFDISNEVTNTAMAVTYDLGHPTDVHPNNKKPVGHRLARLALSNDYGKKLVVNGPIFSDYKKIKSSLKINFNGVSNDSSALTLVDNSKKLKGFEVAAADGVFRAANAEIHKGYVIVNHPEILVPVMVRYGWFDDPKDKANLGNKAGLPAIPFNSQLSQNRYVF